jgi:hypothetical protein
MERILVVTYYSHKKEAMGDIAVALSVPFGSSMIKDGIIRG